LITIFYTFIAKERYAIQRYTIIHKPTKVRAYFFVITQIRGGFYGNLVSIKYPVFIISLAIKLLTPPY